MLLFSDRKAAEAEFRIWIEKVEDEKGFRPSESPANFLAWLQIEGEDYIEKLVE